MSSSYAELDAKAGLRGSVRQLPGAADPIAGHPQIHHGRPFGSKAALQPSGLAHETFRGACRQSGGRGDARMHKQRGVLGRQIQAADQIGHAPQPLEVSGRSMATAGELAQLQIR